MEISGFYRSALFSRHNLPLVKETLSIIRRQILFDSFNPGEQ
jgi:hypothetical protein